MLREVDHHYYSEILERGFVRLKNDPSATLPEVVSATLKAVTDHLSSSIHVRQFLMDLPKGQNTCCPDSPIDELVKYVASRSAKIDKSDPALNLEFMEKIVRPAITFFHQEMFAALNDCEDISREEWAMFLNGRRLAEITTELWFKWYEKVVVPFNQLGEDEKKQYEALFSSGFPQFDYTVFDLGRDQDGNPVIRNRQTWAQAFPAEISEIRTILGDLIQTQTSSRQTRAHLEQLGIAYGCTDIEKLEECWAEVDRRWIEIPRTQRVILLYGMENGYEHFRCVSPELQIVVRDKGYETPLAFIRAGIVAVFSHLPLDPEVIGNLPKIFETKLERTDVDAFLPVLIGGVCLNFRAAGQALPNRQDVSEEGGRIFLDPNSCREAEISYAENLKKNCTSATEEALIPLIKANDVLLYIAGHEFSHPVARTAESDAVLGSSLRLLEETKATVGGIPANLRVNSTPNNRLTIVAIMLARIIRTLHKAWLSNPTVANYVTESKVLAQMLISKGVIKVTPEGIDVDVDRVQSYGWGIGFQVLFTEIVSAYARGRCDLLEKIKEEHCDASKGDLAKLIAHINR